MFLNFIFTAVLLSVLSVQLLMHCFSDCWYGCWAGWVLSWWRRSVWWENRVAVMKFTSRRFQRRSSTQSRWAGWDLETFWLTDEAGRGGLCQQPCFVLYLYDVGSTHDEPAWSVTQSTTQRHCPVTLYFLVRRCRNSRYQETHLAAEWLRTMFEFLQFSTRLAI